MKQLRNVIGVAALAYALAFVVFNATARAEVWLVPFVDIRPVPTLVVIAVTVGLTLLVAWAGGPTVRVVWRRRRRS
jgi:hypothetical protein